MVKEEGATKGNLRVTLNNQDKEENLVTQNKFDRCRKIEQNLGDCYVPSGDAMLEFRDREIDC